MKPFTAILPVIASGLISMASAQSANDLSAVVAPGAKLEKLAGDFKFTEGPVWLGQGEAGFLVFSDIPASKLYKWTPKGIEVFRAPSNQANGNTPLARTGDRLR